MRNNGLDVLRAFAVLLVLGKHAAWPVADAWGDLWFMGGWAGVDLFFVLSGFLVSGLLFDRPEWKRFLVRRAWKIYPAFWFFMLVTIWIQRPGLVPTLHELLFIQNYGERVWLHSWSLAVEEHFYLLLPPVLLLTRRWDYKPLPWVVGGIVLACTLGRLFSPEWESNRSQTHLRIDTLWLGVLARYFYNRNRRWVSLLAGPLFAIGAVVLGSAFMTTMTSSVGVLIIALGSVALVLGAVELDFSSRFSQAVAYVGRHSYSIYLWHAPVLFWIALRYNTTVLTYMVVSVLIGITMSTLIETPTLRLRERFAK